jgi:antirestriction protein ArdC
MNTNNSPAKLDLYALVTNQIIDLLEKGIAPWQQPWIDAGIPMNLISKRPYRGINLWLLLSLNYPRNLFLTWDQLKKIGGSVKQGEHGHIVVFWKAIPKKDEIDESGKPKSVTMLRYYKVFNIDQCRELPENLEIPELRKDFDPVLECEAIINQMPQKPPIKHMVQKAFYDKEKDYINMPKKKSFKDSQGYYATLYHELIHSTGHEKRLKRKSITEMAEFGSDLYSFEELIAELGSAYLSSLSGVLVPQNSAAYIGGWLTKLKSDKRFIIQASGFAQKAVDFILNQQIVAENKEEVEPAELLSGE